MEEVSDFRALFVVLCFFIFFDVTDNVFSDRFFVVRVAKRVVDQDGSFLKFFEVFGIVIHWNTKFGAHRKDDGNVFWYWCVSEVFKCLGIEMDAVRFRVAVNNWVLEFGEWWYVDHGWCEGHFESLDFSVHIFSACLCAFASFFIGAHFHIYVCSCGLFLLVEFGFEGVVRVDVRAFFIGGVFHMLECAGFCKSNYDV